MKETFKKIRYILLVLLLLVVNFAMPTKEVAEAKTLRDLKEELAELERKQSNIEYKKITAWATLRKEVKVFIGSFPLKHHEKFPYTRVLREFYQFVLFEKISR